MITVKGMATLWEISASGYFALISASMRFLLFMTQPAVGHVAMQIFFGGLDMTAVRLGYGYGQFV